MSKEVEGGEEVWDKNHAMVLQEANRMMRVLTVLKAYIAECDETYNEERAILPLHRWLACVWLCMGVCVCLYGYLCLSVWVSVCLYECLFALLCADYLVELTTMTGRAEARVCHCRSASCTRVARQTRWTSGRIATRLSAASDDNSPTGALLPSILVSNHIRVQSEV